jgi:hypothetical protein
MQDTPEPKALARALRAAMAQRSVDLGHSECLEIVAKMFGHADWNVLAAKTEARTAPAMDAAIPLLRIFDIEKARDFYVGLLAMTVDWEHRFGADFPIYMQVSRGALRLHLTEHHGDATPGSTAFVWVHDLDRLQQELASRGSRAGVEPGPGDFRMIQLWDPFGNRLRLAGA